MAKLLISCDDYIFSYQGNYYFKNKEWSDFYYRYLRIFDEIRICNRVIIEDSLNPNRIMITDKRIEVYPVPIFHGPKEYITVYFAVGKALKNAVKGCDAAVLRLPSTVAQRLSKQVIKSKIPYATEIVFDANDGYKTANNILEKMLWKIIDMRMRRICSSADGVSCVTEKYLQQHYFSIKRGHFESNYSTLSLDKSFFSGGRKYPQKKILTIAHVDLQIGLHSRKGTDIIIKAISELKGRGMIVNVKFAGDDWDNSTEAILKYARKFNVAEQVECVGFLTRAQLDTFLDDADLFVLPTKAEGLPRVIIEALAKGLPTITTPASGNPELVSADYLVAFSDVKKLSDKIYELATNHALYERISAENYQRSLKYEATKLQERRDKFYSKLYQAVKD